MESKTDIDRYKLRANELQFLVVDVQERLVAVMPERAKVVANVGHLLTIAKLFTIPVAVTEQYPRGLGPSVTEVAEAVPAGERMEKLEFSCLDQRDVAERLKAAGRPKIAVVGMEAHVCILQTCLDLLAEGYVVHVVRDAVCSRSAEDKENALEMMRDAGSVITTTETVLFQVLGRAGTEEFKAVSRRIR